MVRFLVTLLLGLTLSAQTFQIVPSTAPRGGAGLLLVAFISPPGKEPVALQWKIVFGTEVTAAVRDITADDAAKAAGKALVCAPAAESEKGSSAFNCILAGGKKAIANGTIVLAKYGVKPAAAPKTAVVRISDGIAVSEQSNQLRRTPLAPAEGTISIR